MRETRSWASSTLSSILREGEGREGGREGGMGMGEWCDERKSSEYK